MNRYKIKKTLKGYVVLERVWGIFWMYGITYRGSTKAFYFSSYESALSNLGSYVIEETRWK